MKNIPADSENPFQSPPPPLAPTPAPSRPSVPAFSRFGDILGRAFNRYFQQWSQWPVPLLVCGLIALACFMLCFFPILLAQGPLICALYWCAFCNLRGWPVDTAALNRGWELFWPAMTSTIILWLIEFIPGMVMQLGMLAVLAYSGALVIPAAGPPDPVQFFRLWFNVMVVCMPLGLVALVATFWFRTRTIFVMPLVADRGYDFSTAWQASWEATRHRFWERLVLLVLAQFIGMLGSYFCYVGLLFTLPLQFLIIAAAYEDEFGIEGLPSVSPEWAGGSPFQPYASATGRPAASGETR